MNEVIFLKPNHIYDLVTISEDLTCDVYDLEPDTGYFIKINAENELGIGYEEEPFFVRTMPAVFDKPCGLYVWGANTQSQLGLSDEQISANIKLYHKYRMTQPLKNETFKN